MAANLENDKYFLNLVKTGHYKVFKNGNVLNTKTLFIYGSNKYDNTITSNNSNGYISLAHRDLVNKKVIHMQAHRLVWSVFKGPITDSSLVINHKDGNKINNCIRNLELVTNSNNVLHAYDIGLNVPIVGKKSPFRIFTDLQVKDYRKLYFKGIWGYRTIMWLHNCGKSTVKGMIHKTTYNNVK